MNVSRDSSLGCNAMPALTMPSWMNGFNNMLDVVDKIGDAINGRICADESGGESDEEEELHDLDRKKNSRNSRRYNRMREQRVRRRKRLEKARRHRNRQNQQETRREKDGHRSPAVVSEDDRDIDDNDMEEDEETVRNYQVRFSPGTIVDESDNDNDDDDNDGHHEVGKEEESTTDGEISRSTTHSSSIRSITPTFIRSITPTSVRSNTTTSVRSTTPTSVRSITPSIISGDGSTSDTIIDNDDDHLNEGGSGGGDTKLNKKLLHAIDENNVPPEDGNDSFDIVHSLGSSPKKPKRMERISRSIQHKSRRFPLLKRDGKNKASGSVAEGSTKSSPAEF